MKPYIKYINGRFRLFRIDRYGNLSEGYKSFETWIEALKHGLNSQ